MLKIIIKNRYLLGQLTKKDIELKYKGSVLGLLWSALVPIFMLTIYTFMFSSIFTPTWNIETSGKGDFALILFCGLSVFNMISDVMGRSTGLIAGNVNYVKKVIFPLELLPVSITLSALFNSVISFAILVIMKLILQHTISITLVFIIPAFIPLILFTIGLSLIISAISVYLKDIASAISVVITLLMYVSPVFFPLGSGPEIFRVVCRLNPITYIIENFRNVTLYGKMLDMEFYFISCICAVVSMWIGSTVFRRAKEGFADVL